MTMRTDKEIKAYIDGYKECFERFKECLRRGKSRMAAVRMMKEIVEMVERVCCEQEGAEQE